MKGKLIGRGRTAEVFAWGETQALKLYYQGWPASHAEAEARIAHAVYAAGAPAPAVHGVVEMDGRFGVIYERVDGISLLNHTTSKPWTVVRSARLQAELHARMHALRPSNLPSQREQLERKIRAARPLPASMKEAALATLARLPDGDQLCHGDFHPDNIAVSERGPVILDWVAASYGNPLADVARSSLLMQLATLPPNMPRRHLIELGRSMWHTFYLRRYCELRGVSPAQVKAWMLPVAAARLEDGIPEEEPGLLNALEAL